MSSPNLSHDTMNCCYSVDGIKINLDARTHRIRRIFVNWHKIVQSLSLEYNAEGQIIYYKFYFKTPPQTQMKYARLHLDDKAQVVSYEDGLGNHWHRDWDLPMPFDSVSEKAQSALSTLLFIAISICPELKALDRGHFQGGLLPEDLKSLWVVY